MRQYMLTVNSNAYATGTGLSFALGESLFVDLTSNLTAKKVWEVELTFFAGQRGTRRCLVFPLVYRFRRITTWRSFMISARGNSG
jgi:hypothetical protein